MNTRKRRIVIALLVLLVLLSFPAFWIYREVQQDRLNSSLIAAIKQEDTRSALALLDQGADANAVDTEQIHTLQEVVAHLIAQARHLPATEVRRSKRHALALLLDEVEKEGTFDDLDTLGAALVLHGADRHFQVSERCPNILVYAARNNLHRTFGALLAKGADINGEDAAAPPLGAADKEILLMLARGADPNKQDPQGNTALFYQLDYDRRPNKLDRVRILLVGHLSRSLPNQ